jgi:glycosyltransferase involved in cell wall biosynthesis
MRILLLTPMPPDPEAPGAIPVLLHAQLTGLAERNEVTVVTPAGPDPPELHAVERLAADGFEVHAVPRHFPLEIGRWRRRRRLAGAWLRGRWPWRTVWFWEPALQPALDELLAKRHFDVVAVEDNAMGIYRLTTGAAKVFTEHEVRRPRKLDLRAGAPNGWLRWAFREADWIRWPRYQRAVWSRFDAIQVFTERDAGSLAEIAPSLASRVRVNPFGIELPAIDDPVEEEPSSVLFLGNFTHPPNVDAAVWLAREIMPRVRDRYPGARLSLAGIHAPREVKALSGPDVSVLGFVPDVESLVRRAAVLAAPVRTGGGMRMKLLHSMALGKGVVTTPRGTEGLVRSEGEPPILVADDSDGLAAAVGRLLTDPEERAALGARARSYVAEHHSAEAYARRLESVYGEVLAQADVREAGGDRG